ncbi:fructan beta-fructosidase [Flavobacteriaceae bacterium MAR_2009_75]|nr:fructan beta-fructosidase [Flavobacteriaceae bacterium MAR_2009_75]
MKFCSVWFILFSLVIIFPSCRDKTEKQPSEITEKSSQYYSEDYRPQFHFSPEKMWMNDPNGMVYNKGVYHLFYQYYPDSIVWGPMHWGHAISKDLIHWQHKPVALYPDELGYIFSGSAVLDESNSSGFGTDENPPLVAIYTYHDSKGEKRGESTFQTQGIAYSLDNGDSWTKYEKNPVIGNEGIRDFRDPKVMWHEPTQRWIMTLVAGDHAQFYSSTNLKEWQLSGEFGKEKGAHGGVWECPDLFKLKVADSDEEKWVLLISINPGAPNGGNGTQYFIGDFDGNTFVTEQKENRWVDWGTDNYAGVTYSNAPNDEKIFIGWMSNWLYAQATPTEKWRSAMTVPRKFNLQKVNGEYCLFNYPIPQLNEIVADNFSENLVIGAHTTRKIEDAGLQQAEVFFNTEAKNFQLKLSNELGEELLLSMRGGSKQFLLDRTSSGMVDFQEDFGEGVQIMPVPNLPDELYEVRVLLDQSSIEIFINKGQYVMTAQLFPNEAYNKLTIENLEDEALNFTNFKISKIESVW